MLPEKVCVVIPVHSSSPSNNELISFKQCFKVLGNHPIYIIAPENLNLDNYKSIVGFFNVIYINPKWQSTIVNYNKLKLSRYFYSLFKDYEYLLTYELDAFVFKDELLYWCEKNYDYIGAPWFEGFHLGKFENKFKGVGNSGFSLRNIKKMNLALTVTFYNKYSHDLWYKSFLNKFRRKTQSLFGENYSIQKDYTENEDFFIFSEIAGKLKDFKIASIEDAIKFSFETNPRQLFEINNLKLPFGCHAWERYDLEFWKKHIKFSE